MSRLSADYRSLAERADELERMAAQVAALVPEIAVYAARSGLHELIAYGLVGGLPVAADLVALCLPGTAGSLPDLAAELFAMGAAVRAAGVAYRAVDGARWSLAELPTAGALLMLEAWRRTHLVLSLTSAGSCTPPLTSVLIGQAAETAFETGDRWIEGAGRVANVDPTTMPPLPAQPARNLSSVLGVVDSISDAAHPSTVALIRVGSDPPRYVVCLPGLQDAAGADAGAADLPGAIATLTGHSSYIRGMRAVLGSLPAGSAVLLVGHSQGGMVAEALAEQGHIGGTTIAGVVTAGSPLLRPLLPTVSARVPSLALQNTEDPVPRLGQLAGGLPIGLGSALPGCSAPDRTLVTFRTPGAWPSGAKHGLGSGGYLTEADSGDRRVAAFRDRMSGFFTPGPVDIRYLQVTDSDGTLPR